MKRITNLADLKAHLARGHRDHGIALAGGLIWSLKHIAPRAGGRFKVVHGIDGSMETLSEAELGTETNIGVAMRAGAFYCEERLPRHAKRTLPRGSMRAATEEG